MDASLATQPGAPRGPGLPISLADLVSRNLTIEWYEAVAIVQAVCDALPAQPAAARPAPELTDVLIEPSGAVRLLSDARPNEAAVNRVGRILSALLATPHTPPPLRLVVHAAVSPTPLYGSTEDLAKALAYFERPGRVELIRGVYQRYHEVVPPRMPGAERREAVTSRCRTWAGRLRLHRKQVAAGVVTAAAIGAGALWLSLTPRPFAWLSVVRARIPSPDVQTTTRAAAALVSKTIASVQEQLGVARDTAQASQPSPSPAASVRPSPALSRQSGSSVTTTPVPRVDAPVVGAPGPSEENGAAGARAVEDVDLEAGKRKASESEPLQVAIYTEADADVTPPVPLRPAFPTSLPPPFRAADVIVLELLVDERGEVESVRLPMATGRVQDSMMLSAAKAWRFKAAMKDGKPVRYLKRFRIASSR